jgi:chromate transporter
LICAALWTLPLGILAAIEQDFLLTLGLFFSKLAVVTFGGAYAVLAYMAQAVVQDHGWLNMPQMMDALGLAETTPGPLILVTQFVATLAGQFQGGWGLALITSLLALWTTFLPCFLWIFAGAPYVDLITRAPRLSAALSAITAAVAGVIANLTIWFAIQVMFSRVNETRLGPVPDLSSFSPEAAGLMPLAALLMLGLKQSMMRTLCLMALAGLGWGLIGPTLI